MRKKEKLDLIAVIDIGSNGLRLKIAQSGKNKLKYIEALNYPLNLGRDTFDTGKISFDKVDKMCEIITNFTTVASEYGVTDIKTVATTAVREATNRDYILDQIKIKTTLDVEIIDDTDEKLYIYKLMCSLINEELKKSAMMVYIGSGNVGVSLLENSKIPYMRNIKVGSLRLSEIFMELQDNTSQYYRVVEEYLESFTNILSGFFPKAAKHFIASGHEVSLIAELCEAQKDKFFVYISKDKFLSLYNHIKYKTVDYLQLQYNLTAETAEVLLPAMAILNNLLKMTQADRIIAPPVFLIDSLLFKSLYPDEFSAINKEFNKSTILCAKELANRYQVDEIHYTNVEKYALKIFDKMKKIHGMGVREKLLLQTAAILHDAGNYINPRHHYNHSYNIINGSDIVGLNSFETEIVACIAMYHSRIKPELTNESYMSLPSSERVLISKLTAILRMADSLDRSQEQKFDSIEVNILDDTLTITISSNKNTDLEQWAFNQKSLFFEEVFGMKAVFKKKRVM